MKKNILSFLEKNNILDHTSFIFQFSFLFILFIFVLSPIIGTIFEFIGIKWNIIVVLLISIFSFVLSYLFTKKDYFKISNWKTLFCMGGIFIFAVVIYGQYSPVLEIRQDPSLYMFKSMNLVNYGTLSKPFTILNDLITNNIINGSFDGYATIQNGTQLINDSLYVDFFPGGAFFAAFFGVFSKELMFYSQSLIMVINGLLLFFIIKKITVKLNDFSIFLLCLAFLISPLIVFFGRGTYCEPSAMLYILLIVNLLLKEDCNVYLISLVFLGSQCARIDYLLIVLIGVLVITYKNRRVGLFYSLIAILSYLMYSKVYWIYYNRITVLDMPILKYGVYLIIIAYIISFIICKWGKSIFENFVYSKWFKYTLYIVGLIIVLFMFKDNLVSVDNYETADIHGKIIMTYSEFIWDLLFLSFPSIILVGGMINFSNFINKDHIPFLASGFLVASLFVYLYFFLGASNSPQLYWIIRRYYNLIVPILFISFCILIDGVNKKTMIIISLSLFLISTNLFVNSKQTVDYKGLDKSLKDISNYLDEKDVDVIFYDSEIRYEISSLLSYDNSEFIPISGADLSNIMEYDKLSDRNFIYLTNKQFNQYIDIFQMNFQKMGEDYGRLPEETYSRVYSLFVFDKTGIQNIIDNSSNYIYPSFSESEINGLYDDGWTNGTLQLDNLNLDLNNKNFICIEMQDYENYLIKNNILDCILYLNDETRIEPFKIEGNIIYFDISNINNIYNMQVLTNTFNLSKEGITSDTRDLGICIKSIYLN